MSKTIGNVKKALVWRKMGWVMITNLLAEIILEKIF